MLSALISSAGRKPAVLLAEQLAHESCVRPGPLVLGTALLKSPTPTEDRDRHVCYHRYSPVEYRGPGHFCLALHVAMQFGPYLHRQSCSVFGVWSLRIPDACVPHPAFPADCPHWMDCHCSRYSMSEYHQILGVSSIWPNL